MHQICTIVASNYIPQALAFLESVRNIYPEIRCTVLITDAICSRHELGANTLVISPSDLSLSPDKISAMRSYYDPVEFATAMKPYLLSYLLAHGAVSATFLDPDTQIYGSLDGVFELAEKYDAVLTPHRLTPIESNSNFYSEKTFLTYGTYNLGFISVGKTSVNLLAWWESRLLFDATRYLNDHIFTDQKWANQFPSYFNCIIYKQPDINLAPWNLDERGLNIQNGKLYTGDFTLKMIHFSQMSATLARGEDTNLWGATLNGARDEQRALSLINQLTQNYKERLAYYSDYENYLSVVGIPTEPLYSSFYRSHLRKSYMRLGGFPQSFLDFVYRLIPGQKIFEKSETFVALATYLPKDLRKLLNYRCFRIWFRRK